MNAAGRRAATLRDGVPERFWVYQDGLNPIAELDGDGNVRAWFVYGPVGGAIDFEYNLRGQMSARTLAGARTEYEYDELGHLHQVRLSDGTELTYLIDSAGRRAAKLRDGVPERFWVYQDGLNPIAELDGDGNVRAWFVYATKAWVPDYALTPDGGVYRVVSDQVGSVRAVVDVRSGVTVQSYAYSPYGRVVASNVQRDIVPFRFAGGLFDQDTGLYRFGARDYDRVWIALGAERHVSYMGRA